MKARDAALPVNGNPGGHCLPLSGCRLGATQPEDRVITVPAMPSAKHPSRGSVTERIDLPMCQLW